MKKTAYYTRGEPFAPACPKAFHFGDYVETYDRTLAGFVRGAFSMRRQGSIYYLVQISELGDVAQIVADDLELVLRANDPEAMKAAYEAYQANVL